MPKASERIAVNVKLLFFSNCRTVKRISWTTDSIAVTPLSRDPNKLLHSYHHRKWLRIHATAVRLSYGAVRNMNPVFVAGQRHQALFHPFLGRFRGTSRTSNRSASGPP